MKEVNPQETSRAYAYCKCAMMNAPMPMVTSLQTLNVITPCENLAGKYQLHESLIC